MNPPSTPPEALPANDVNEGLTPRQMKLAFLWVLLVTIAYLGTIVNERGERIGRIVRSVFSRWAE